MKQIVVMENTIENANKFYLNSFGMSFPQLMVAYASQITQSAPVSERIKIVVPKYDTSNPKSDKWIESKNTWNNCLALVRTLNPGAEVVEAKF